MAITDMDKLYLQLGKLGDLLNILPLAYADAQSGKSVGVMTCPEYLGVLDGCSYVTPVRFAGQHWEITKAHAEAIKLAPAVFCGQVNGPKADVLALTYTPAGQKNAVTDSHNREQWKLAGMLPQWGNIPLVFDRRDGEREKALLPKGKKPFILVSADSASSPFPYKALLLQLLRLRYAKQYQIIDLATVRAHRFYDLLGLFEAAHCLVTVDTAHLHLAYAVPHLPVMALVQDRPLYWHGSAWRPTHRFHCRYHDFPARALSLFTAIDGLGKSEPSTGIHVYPGEVRPHDCFVEFPIQPGACHRDSVNVLQDKERHPMLRNVIRMATTGTFHPTDVVTLTRQDTELNGFIPHPDPVYAFRMNRDKAGNDTFAPVVDLFSAPVVFWCKVFPEVPDVVMGNDGFWSRILMEIFKAHGAKEVEGIYRNA